MFGYVTTNMEEMKIKDYRIYHGFYCGVCQDLKEDHGQTSRVTLTYDVTFLGILLTGLYETETKREEHFCASQFFGSFLSVNAFKFHQHCFLTLEPVFLHEEGNHYSVNV